MIQLKSLTPPETGLHMRVDILAVEHAQFDQGGHVITFHRPVHDRFAEPHFAVTEDARQGSVAVDFQICMRPLLLPLEHAHRAIRQGHSQLAKFEP